VKRAGIDVELGRDAGGEQPARVVQILVEKEVERAGGDEGRRQPGQILGARSGGIGRDLRAARLLTQQRRPAEAIVVRGPDELPRDRVRSAGAGAAAAIGASANPITSAVPPT
jgi:hypothetical protein